MHHQISCLFCLNLIKIQGIEKLWDMNNNIINLIVAIVLSVAIIFGWQHFYEKPKLEQLAKDHKQYNEQIETKKLETSSALVIKDKAEVVASGGRVKIKTSSLSGSISTKGLRFDDLVLLSYKQDLSENSKNVDLLAPSNTENAYFAEIGWFGQNIDDDFPNQDTIWQADSDELTSSKPVSFKWVNKNGVEFGLTVSIDDHYMFTVSQTTVNNSAKPLPFQYYSLINRSYYSKEKLMSILHQGPIGVINGQLEEHSYDEVKDKKIKNFQLSTVDWVGITDKYWLTAFIPDKSVNYNSNFTFAINNGAEKFQTDMLSSLQVLESGAKTAITTRLFAGAKKVKLLDKYERLYNIKLFDRAIDFGWFYVLTKPVFNAMNFFYGYVGNFGVSILIVTVIIKLLMFTLANKSYRSMKKMKKLQPQIERIKTLYGEDKTRLNQEIMNLYKKEKVNPVSGCLPLFVQIPVFFSIYKVLYVTIEMRHAPFFGWIKDLSAPDPTSIFNLFGLLPFTPPAFLAIGVWPIFMALTMFLQQRMSPEPADPAQAMMMRFMPLVFLVMFGSFPAGLLIYWSWNNILSIVQQYYINKLDKQP